MGNQRGLGLHLISICLFFIAATYTCCGDGNISVVCSEKERVALLKFKHSVRDDLEMLSSWVGNDCCRWGSIQCDTVTGNVESLYLRGDEGYLVGNEVNASLAELKHLKHLDLSGNDFQGSRIPKFIGSLKQLIYLNLSNVGFEGIIPHNIGNLSNLKLFDLSWNGGLVADDMAWTSGLSSLEHLVLSSVDLGRAQNMDMLFYMIPSLKELSLSDCGLSNADLGPSLNSSKILRNIKHLDLSNNYFQGPLPGFFQNMSSLTFLDLSSFNLSLTWNFANFLSTIPSLSELHLSDCGLDKTHLSSPHLNFSRLFNIHHLDLSRNSIEGAFPSVFTNMSSLRVLDLSGNMLNSWVPVMPNLIHLDLSGNDFKQIGDFGIWRQCHLKHLGASYNHFKIEMIESTENITECSQYALEWLHLSSCSNGTIPDPIARLANLRGIDLSSSSLTGQIPESLGRLKYLEVLDLSSNQLTGPIPTFLGNISELDLSFNQLNGSIPESFGNLAALTHLHLSSNRLTGPIPSSLGGLASLQTVWLYSNLLNGTIPASIGQLAKLRYLDFSNNSLEGVVSEAHFANFFMLKYLDTSSNTKLTFNVSRDWRPPFQLVFLRLKSCTIGTEFPHWIRSQRKLNVLDLSKAQITGPLPTWLRKMPIIPCLDLSHNKLSGPLTNLPNAATYGGYGFVSVLFLENNFFNESIPRSLCIRIDLEYLDLSKNRLTGKIPKCLENMKRLYTMILSSNQLSGVIPSSVALNSLHRLNLNDNDFIGELPRELENLRVLSMLDLGDNRLSGNIPEWVGKKLTYLVVLRLHKNNFTGRIPESLCKSSNLQILDLAHNNLEGTIPICLRKLKAMVSNSGSGHIDYSLDYDVNVDQVMKGVDLEYTKTWYMVYNMDLSSNKLVGEIPVELTALSKLVGLNLSNNHLTGYIPDNIGNMMNLFSLDLSRNELIGMIPPSMTALTFLSHLNLSHNNLSGRIPTGRQLQTLIDPSIYEGNKDLCGPPLCNNCPNWDNPITTGKKKYKAAEESYANIICGFATGFCGIIGVLLFKKQWRRNLFMFAEETMDTIYVAVVVRVRKMKILRKRNHIEPMECT
ncbi:receptor-like protein 48 [Lactuca sativa]|nr:receptor-like protein 48 [Lactuca sativa]